MVAWVAFDCENATLLTKMNANAIVKFLMMISIGLKKKNPRLARYPIISAS
jgi:hypothetical protein